MTTIRNFSELDNYLMKIVQECLVEVGKKVNNCMREHIDSDVYRAGKATNYYAYGTTQPTFELRDSITTSNVRKSGNQAEIQISHDKDKMRLDPDNFVHGSRYWKSGTTDIRELLPEIISFGLSGDLFGEGWWCEPREYYQNTLKELKDNGKLHQWFVEALNKRGIKVLK